MNFLQAIILGIVEGITEFLPISSTGHLILSGHLLGVQDSEFTKTFEIAIQSGAILSVLVLYGRALWANPSIIKKIIVAFLPTAAIGLVLYSFIKEYLLANNQVVLWSLLIGGVLMIIFEHWHKESPEAAELDQLTYKQSFLIGLAQSIAVVPGVSRAAATIIGGLMLGLKRKTIVEFSFLLAMPTMAGATGLDLIKSYDQIEPSQFSVLGVGMVTSFFVAILAIKFLLRYIQTHDFRLFGYYRIALALVFWFLVL